MKKVALALVFILLLSGLTVLTTGCCPVDEGVYYYEYKTDAYDKSDSITVDGSVATLDFTIGEIKYSGEWNIVSEGGKVYFDEKDGEGRFEVKLDGNVLRICIGMGITDFVKEGKK